MQGRVQPLELFNVLCGLFVFLGVFGVSRVTELQSLFLVLFRLAGEDLCGVTLMREKVSDFGFEIAGVVPFRVSLRALELEPQDGVEDTLVRENLVFHGLLEEAICVVFFERSAFIPSFQRGLVEKVHNY